MLAGAAGLGLAVLGWWIVDWQLQPDWGRLSEPSWWTGAVLQGIRYLLAAKLGLKVVVVCVVAVVAAVSWVRSRRVRRAEATALSAVPETPESHPVH